MKPGWTAPAHGCFEMISGELMGHRAVRRNPRTARDEQEVYPGTPLSFLALSGETIPIPRDATRRSSMGRPSKERPPFGGTASGVRATIFRDRHKARREYFLTLPSLVPSPGVGRLGRDHRKQRCHWRALIFARHGRALGRAGRRSTEPGARESSLEGRACPWPLNRTEAHRRPRPAAQWRRRDEQRGAYSTITASLVGWSWKRGTEFRSLEFT